MVLWGFAFVGYIRLTETLRTSLLMLSAPEFLELRTGILLPAQKPPRSFGDSFSSAFSRCPTRSDLKGLGPNRFRVSVAWFPFSSCLGIGHFGFQRSEYPRSGRRLHRSAGLLSLLGFEELRLGGLVDRLLLLGTRAACHLWTPIVCFIAI